MSAGHFQLLEWLVDWAEVRGKGQLRINREEERYLLVIESAAGWQVTVEDRDLADAVGEAFVEVIAQTASEARALGCDVSDLEHLQTAQSASEGLLGGHPSSWSPADAVSEP